MRTLKRLLGSLLATTALTGAADDRRAEFIQGADVSMLNELDRHGARYFDTLGRPADPLQVLQDHGIGWVRLRLWHTPINAADVIDGDRIVSRRGEPVGGGNNDLATTTRLAQRAKARGMKVLLDIHYSDFWADPGHQSKPAAWEHLHGAALEQAVGDYTAQVLRTLADAGVPPDMVQLGNENNGGFLWPDGKTWAETPDEAIGGDAGYVALLQRAVAAVRAEDARRGTRLPVVIHLADSGDNALYRRVFDLLARHAVDYDVIGLSYYPYFHGPVSGLRVNLHDIAERYAKPLLVVETGSAYTNANGDGSPNMLTPELVKKAGYPATVRGQSRLLRDVIAAVQSVPHQRGIGVFYWEPLWIPVAGAGWRTGDGNGWDNQALFDFRGHPLPSLQVFKANAAIRRKK